MGCIISAEGISPTDEKVEAIKQAPRPENSTQLKAFLGMVNYRGKLIRNLSSILQPLNQLLQKNQDFTWTPVRGSLQQGKGFPLILTRPSPL